MLTSSITIMGKLIHATISSLDGYIADTAGNFDWSMPDEEVHAFVNDLERTIGTYLYGRRLYEIMTAWETMPTADEPAVMDDFARIWRAADKIVYSRTLDSVTTPRTVLSRSFDADEIRAMKASSLLDLSIGGAELAGQALAAGLIDECHFFLSPIIVGGGTPSLPAGVLRRLELLDQRRFDNGVVHLHYLCAG